MIKIIKRKGRAYKVTTQIRKFTSKGQTGDLLPEPRYDILELRQDPFPHWSNSRMMTGRGTAATERKALNAGVRRVNAGEFDEEGSGTV